MISVGLWGAQLGAPAIWLLPVAFPMVMAFGGTLGLMGIRPRSSLSDCRDPPSCGGGFARSEMWQPDLKAR